MKDAQTALSEIEAALHNIAWGRPIGDTPKKVDGAMVEAMEKAALKALHALPTLRAALTPPVLGDETAEDEAYKLGICDGYQEAVQDIDRRTGGDGEYRWSTDPERSVPDPAEMIKRIVERFEARALTPHVDADTEELRRLHSVWLTSEDEDDSFAFADACGNALPGLLAAKAERDGLKRLVQAMLDNDPDELAADGGITVLDVWRKDARAALNQEPGE